MPNGFQDMNFDFVIPLAFRVVLLLSLGAYLWYALVWYCYNVQGMNVLALLNLSYSTHKYSSSDHTIETITGEEATVNAADPQENLILLNGIYSVIKRVSVVAYSAIILYWTVAFLFSTDSSIYWFLRNVVPTAVLIHILSLYFGKGSSFGRNRIYSTIKRILLGDINSSSMRTNDILISDSFTSYSRVFNDLILYLWMTYLPINSSYHPALEAFVLATPGVIRIKQCWSEFLLTGQRQHLFNLLKYTTGIGPIIVNLLLKTKLGDITEQVSLNHQLNVLNRWWYCLAALNSTYLFIWDVKMDWGFKLFDPIFEGSSTSVTLLREPNLLVYKNYALYYGIIASDFVLRYIWLLKLYVIKDTEVELALKNRVGNFFFGLDFLSFGYFSLELLEIFRRWLWCFLKLESDLVKLQHRDDLNNVIPLASVKVG